MPLSWYGEATLSPVKPFVMTTQPTAQSTAQPTARELKKAANRDFTRRGVLLTRIAQQLLALGTPTGWFSKLSAGPVFTAQANGYPTRGTLNSVDSTRLTVQDLYEDDMVYFFRLGQLTTASLAELVAVLSKLKPAV